MRPKPILVIMAAGMGSRYGGLKQMDPVGSNGELIIDFSLYDAWRAGFDSAVCIIKKEIADDFRAIMDRGAARCMDIRYAFQEIDDVPAGTEIPAERKKPWGTGHALLQAKPLIEGPFAVINADDYYGPGAFSAAYDHLMHAQDQALYDYCVIGYSIENTLTEHGHVARGVCSVSPAGDVTEICELKKIQRIDGEIRYTEDDLNWTPLPEGTPVSMNFFGFTPSFLETLEHRFPQALARILNEDPLKGEFFVPLVAGDLVKEGRARIRMIPSPDRWYGVTYREDRALVVQAMEEKKQQGLYPDELWSGSSRPEAASALNRTERTVRA